MKNYDVIFIEDLDIAAEIRYYYETFYGYTLSDENVQRILNHQMRVNGQIGTGAQTAEHRQTE